MKKFILLFVVLIYFFNISNSQTLDIIFPNGDEHFMNNTWSPHNITWESTGIASFKLEYSLNGGSDWVLIEDNYTVGNYYSWDVPDVESAICLIRITDAVGGTISDESDAVFNITSQNIFVAEWNTSMGMFRAELRGDLAPVTVQNFINLADRGFYYNLIFHRVVHGFVIQDGCPNGTGSGGPGWTIDLEIHPDLRHNDAGILAMARAADPNSAGSQYYFTLDPEPGLDDNYAVFGRTIDGVNTILEIGDVAVDGNDRPIVDVDIYSVDIVESIPELNLVYPTNGLNIEQGREIDILWESDFIADAKIEFSSNNGSNWTDLTDSIPSGEEIFPWIVPDITSSECIIKITSLKNPNDYKDSVLFEIREKPAELSRFELYEGVTPPENNTENLILPDNNLSFKINILNLFGEEITTVNASLVSHNDDLSVVTGTVTFSNISTGGDEWSDQSFEIQLPENVPGNGQYSFSLYGTASNVQDNFWLGDFNLPVLKKFPFMTVDDDDVPDSNGNGNGIIEPDETIEFEVKFDNQSDETLYNVYGQLTTEANYINIWNNVSGIDGMVYDTSAYNNGNPINPNSSGQEPMHDFVFDYTGDDIYNIDFLLKIYGYLYEEEGANWDEGGILMKWGIPVELNSSYPPAGIDKLTENSGYFNILQNPVSNSITISFDYSNTEQNNIKLELIDIQGKTVLTEQLYNTSRTHKINVSGLMQGLYFVRINNFTKKVVVLKN